MHIRGHLAWIAVLTTIVATEVVSQHAPDDASLQLAQANRNADADRTRRDERPARERGLRERGRDDDASPRERMRQRTPPEGVDRPTSRPLDPDAEFMEDEFEPGRPDGRGPRGPMFAPGPERIERAMNMLKEKYPRLYAKLDELRQSNPRAFYREMGHLMPKLYELARDMRLNPQIAEKKVREHELEIDIHDAVQTYHLANDDAERARVRAHIKELVGQQFDVRQERFEMMLEELERRLQQRKKELEATAAKKDTLIDADVERRLNPGFWGPGPDMERGPDPDRRFDPEPEDRPRR